MPLSIREVLNAVSESHDERVMQGTNPFNYTVQSVLEGSDARRAGERIQEFLQTSDLKAWLSAPITSGVPVLLVTNMGDENSDPFAGVRGSEHLLKSFYAQNKCSDLCELSKRAIECIQREGGEVLLAPEGPGKAWILKTATRVTLEVLKFKYNFLSVLSQLDPDDPEHVRVLAASTFRNPATFSMHAKNHEVLCLVFVHKISREETAWWVEMTPEQIDGEQRYPVLMYKALPSDLYNSNNCAKVEEYEGAYMVANLPYMGRELCDRMLLARDAVVQAVVTKALSSHGWSA